MSTSVLSLGAPRMETAVRLPAGPDCVATTPGAVESRSAAKIACRAWMSASVIT